MEAVRPLCVVCNTRKAKKASRRPGKFEKRCNICSMKPETYERIKQTNRASERPHRAFKKDSCERCGFVAEHPVQLDVDHIDGNHSNNDPSNLQTLCANCHRLKTWQAKEYMPGREVTSAA
ncbi:HNH endonuclease [Streptomyces phage Muntaha]|uniref:HNH endonuclease n=1 Tax=Streptomyces phage Muntaha TaxID=2713269 RepID=A0A6G8R352_9CAUD|nr:HNH endonuclease [Streptomyces phage Muntaha]QIN94635.1 HNH endonuclease [Streptomyces phage Muntaha]